MFLSSLGKGDLLNADAGPTIDAADLLLVQSGLERIELLQTSLADIIADDLVNSHANTISLGLQVLHVSGTRCASNQAGQFERGVARTSRTATALLCVCVSHCVFHLLSYSL